MSIELNGATRVYYVVGDPIAQVKSPQGVTVQMQQLGGECGLYSCPCGTQPIVGICSGFAHRAQH